MRYLCNPHHPSTGVRIRSKRHGYLNPYAVAQGGILGVLPAVSLHDSAKSAAYLGSDLISHKVFLKSFCKGHPPPQIHQRILYYQ